jgi:PAS domain S-box-containing protein
MQERQPSENHLRSELERLNLEVKQLNQKLRALQQEKTDLEILFEETIDHSDRLLNQLRQEKADLELLLENTLEHSDSVESAMYDKAEKVKRQSEEQFAALTEAAPVAILVTEIADGSILYANSTASAIFGFSLKENSGIKATELYNDPADRHQLLAILAEEGRVTNCELQCKAMDGSPLWFIASLRPFMFGDKYTLLTTLCDITDRKLAEEALRIAEENYRSIFENAVEGIFQTADDGHYIQVNSAFARIYGYDSPEELIVNISDISHQIYVDPNQREVFKRLLEEQGQVKEFEYQVYRRDGTIIWLSESARAVRDRSGLLLYYEGTCLDITERKREEEALKRQVELLQIEIDQAKRERQVVEITQADYFKELQEELDRLQPWDFDNS